MFIRFCRRDLVTTPLIEDALQTVRRSRDSALDPELDRMFGDKGVDAARGRHGGGERAVIQACRLLTAFAAFFTLTLSARAQDALSGAAVLERCTSAEASNVNWCVGFVYGVGAVVADGSIEGRLRACPPPDFTAETARLLVVSTLEKTDALRDLPGAYAVWYAFRKEFPCR